MNETICSIEVPKLIYNPSGPEHTKTHESYRIRLSAVEGVHIQIWQDGTGFEKTKERGDFVNIMFRNWGIHCQMNDPGVADFIREYNRFGNTEAAF